jgi:uncharacterized protein
MSSLLGRPVQRPPMRVHQLADADRDDFARLLDTEPEVNAVLASRLRALRTLAPRAFGGSTFGVRDGAGRLTGAAFDGGNLLPVGGGPAEWYALGKRLRERRRACTSVVGRSDAVQALWQQLAPVWGPARTIRETQPLLSVDAANCPPGGDPRVRVIRPDELEIYLPAAAAMFSEELGMSPMAGGVDEYRRRVGGLLRERRAFGIVDADGRVLFKADIGAVSARTCQLQGVWVRPDARGRGIGTAALPVVIRHALSLAPTVSLYVNDFNTAARRMYARLGMRQVATLTTVLF